MLANYHTHTVLCDGDNTPEELVLYSINNGFDAIGFSGHGYTSFDERYCMKDTSSYIDIVNNLKIKYKDKIQIYLGIEEDMYHTVAKENFDYIIGSSHYILKNGEYYPIDSSFEHFKKCLDLFNGDILKLSDSYYSAFCTYLNTRKPNIAGHFDLITKYAETENIDFFKSREYLVLSEKYIIEAAKSDVIFEVNTGAMARGLRTNPYPYENLLYALKKEDAKLILSSDCHSIDKLDYFFSETRDLLKEIGFNCVYILLNNEFKKDKL